jgi:hypothetical protein
VNFVRPSVGAWVLYGLGTHNEDLPGFITINPPSGLGGAQNYGSSFLPASYQGTRIDAADRQVADIRNAALTPGPAAAAARPDPADEPRPARPVRPERAARRRDRVVRARVPHAGGRPAADGFVRRAAETLAAYGADAGPTQSFGRQCLLARRFAEAGVRFIEVCHQGWDQHANLKTALTRNCGATDKPIAALLNDLDQRGLLKDTLVVWGGEFGRTPNGQGGDGRNHNNRGYTMWLAGGGAKPGRAGARPTSWAARPSRTRPTSTTCTRRCSRCSASTTSG